MKALVDDPTFTAAVNDMMNIHWEAHKDELCNNANERPRKKTKKDLNREKMVEINHVSCQPTVLYFSQR